MVGIQRASLARARSTRPTEEFNTPAMASLHVERPYRPVNAVQRGITSSIPSAAAGLFVSAMQNTLETHNRGALGVFTRTGSTIVIFTAMGGAYSFVSAASSNLREKSDAWNAFWGGAVAGAIGGLKQRTFPAMLGCGAALGVLMSTLEWTGGSLSGVKNMAANGGFKNPMFEVKDRRPKDEMIARLGGGRGVEV